MQEHHLAWLAAHPHRTEQWLSAHVADGFDVHHIDGDHTNNAPENLALVEHTDHMRVHGMGIRLGRLAPRRNKPAKKPPVDRPGDPSYYSKGALRLMERLAKGRDAC